MQEETPTKAMPSGREFILPAELLKAFKTDVRILKPGQLAGFIIFDMHMLATVLNRGTDTERRELAKQIENVGKAGGEMVIVQPM